MSYDLTVEHGDAGHLGRRVSPWLRVDLRHHLDLQARHVAGDEFRVRRIEAPLLAQSRER